MIETSPASARLAAVLDRLGRLMHARQFFAGLNPAQWEALRFIARANHFSRNPGALAEYLGTTKGTASQTLIALEEKGMIARSRGKRDRRQVLLELTEAGRAALAEDPVAEIAKAAERLDGVDVEALVRDLSVLLLDLRRPSDHPTFGVCGQCVHLGAGEHVEAGGRPGVPTAPYCCRLRRGALVRDDLDRICIDFCATAPGGVAAQGARQGPRS